MISLRKKSCFILIVLCVSLLALVISGAEAGGRYAGASLELGVGARPMALGSAAAAMYGGIENFYYNPAALTSLKKSHVHLMYAPTFGKLTDPLATYHYAGFAYPLPVSGILSLNWTRFSVDDIPIYPQLKGSSFTDRNQNLELRPDGVALGYFRDVEDVVYFTFAKPLRFDLPLGWLYLDLPVEIPLGFNVKVIRQLLYTSRANGMGVDLGAMIRFNLGTLFENKSLGDLTIGFSGHDITQTTIAWSTQHDDRIRRTILVGMAYQHHLPFYDSQLNLYWSEANKYGTEHLFGMEFVMKIIALRIGKNNAGLTAGAGLNFWKVVLDYAFVTTDFENVHRVSCAFTL